LKMAQVSQFDCAKRKLSLNILDFICPQPSLTKYKAILTSEDEEEEIQHPILLSMQSLENSKLKSNEILESLSQMELCPGVAENKVLPLLSQFGNVSFACVMFLIEQRGKKKVVYRSRECQVVRMEEGEMLCSPCSDLFQSLDMDLSEKESPTLNNPDGEIKIEAEEMVIEEIVSQNVMEEDNDNEGLHSKGQSSRKLKEKSQLEIISCKMCDKTFSSNESLSRHIMSVSCEKSRKKKIVNENSFKYQCNLCSNKFKFEKTLANHCKKFHNIGYLKDCPFCDNQFEISESVEILYNHMIDFHESERESDQFQEVLKENNKCKGSAKEYSKICCQECGETFTRRGNLNVHMALKHDPSPQSVTCHICGKSIKNSHLMRAHLRTHDTEAAICPECGATLKNKMYLTAHMRTHNKIPFPCETCGKEFFTKTNLQGHVQFVHLKKLSFKCELCDKSFPTSSKLKNHIMAIHTKEKPFACEKCDYRCCRSDSLNAHIKNVHDKQSISKA